MAGHATAVIDIGKSNAKLALVDPETRVIALRTTANVVRPDGPYPHFDVDRLWRWILDGLAVFSKEAAIGAISVATHGACFALLASDRLAMPILDYEHDGPESVRAEYGAVRGDFAETFSPNLPNGLNAGRQIFWQHRQFPDDFAKVDAILPYPQYWVWRLTGRKVCEATSLGCHTDLWAPRFGRYAHLVAGRGWRRLFPTLVGPWDTVGTLSRDVAAVTGVSSACRVVAGIHDSNASLLPHLLSRREPFAVLSTGTWLITLAPGGKLDQLDPARDCLANVDAFGRAVPSARFMSGREFEIICDGETVPADTETVHVVTAGIMALPTFAPNTGPFGDKKGRWTVDPSRLTQGERSAAASLYCALVAETCLVLTGAGGPIIVEGPLARNTVFLGALAQLVPRPVIAQPDATGTTGGAAFLVNRGAAQAVADPPPTVPLTIDLTRYAAEWRRLAGSIGLRAS